VGCGGYQNKQELLGHIKTSKIFWGACEKKLKSKFHMSGDLGSPLDLIFHHKWI